MSQPTYCLHKLQAVLADFLDIDKSSLPDVRDILKKEGYIGVQKGEEIQYFYTPQTLETIANIQQGTPKGRDMFIVGKENLSNELIEWVRAHNTKIDVDRLDNTQAQQMGFTYTDNVRRTIDSSAINHILKRHGEQSTLTKNGQPPITLSDIAEYAKLSDGANETFVDTQKRISFNQVNGYYVVIEEARTGQNELALKTMYKQNGDYKNSTAYKEASDSQTLFKGYEPHANSFESLGDSTTTPPNTQPLSPLQKALQEKQHKLDQEATELEKAQERERAKLQEYTQKIEDLDKQKKALAGLSANERTLKRAEPIAHTPIGVDSNLVLDNDKIIPLKYVKIKASDVAPNFESNALQPRTNKQDSIIESIAKDFKAPLMIGVGGFRDLPIITQWGSVISGNHRLEGMLRFSPQSRKTYEQAIKQAYGIELAPDELIVRMPKDNLSDKDLVDLAFASNLETTQNIGDKALGSLGKYAKAIDNLPRYIESESVEDLAYQVARKLEKDNAYPDIESTNLALLSHLAKNSNGKNIADVLNTLESTLPKESAAKLKDMFVKNAGAWHNLVNNLEQAGLKSLELRPYLLDSISATAHALAKERAQNFGKLAHDIQYLIDTTDNNGMSAMLTLHPEIYKNTISDLLGASLARFVRLENPAGSLYDVLKNTKSDLEELVTPTFFKEGKSIEQADIYDFIENLIAKGEPSNATSKVIDLLPALRDKERAYKAHAGEAHTTPKESDGNSNNITKDTAHFRENLQELKGETPLSETGDKTPQEIKEHIQKWDLSKPSPNDKIIVGKVEGEELEQLKKDFDFKGNYPITREIDAQHIAHTLNRHSDEAIESARNQIPITIEDIANYEQIIKTADTRELKGKKIIYKKQINGHYVVVEEVLTGKNKLRFKTMWKSKGNITPPSTPSTRDTT